MCIKCLFLYKEALSERGDKNLMNLNFIQNGKKHTKITHKHETTVIVAAFQLSDSFWSLFAIEFIGSLNLKEELFLKPQQNFKCLIDSQSHVEFASNFQGKG